MDEQVKVGIQLLGLVAKFGNKRAWRGAAFTVGGAEGIEAQVSHKIVPGSLDKAIGNTQQ